MKTNAVLISLVLSGSFFFSQSAMSYQPGAYSAYPYAPQPYYGYNGNDFFNDGSFFGDSRGRGNGKASGEGEFSFSFSGKAKGEQLREGSFGGSGYGSNNNAPYAYQQPARYYGPVQR